MTRRAWRLPPASSRMSPIADDPYDAVARRRRAGHRHRMERVPRARLRPHLKAAHDGSGPGRPPQHLLPHRRDRARLPLRQRRPAESVPARAASNRPPNEVPGHRHGRASSASISPGACFDDGHVVIGFDGMTPYYDVALKEERHAILARSNGFTAGRSPCWKTGGARPRRVTSRDRRTSSSISPPRLACATRWRTRAPMLTQHRRPWNLLEPCRQLAARSICCLPRPPRSMAPTTRSPFAETDRADEPLTLYAATKKAMRADGPRYAHLYRLPTTVFRFFTVYGPWGRPGHGAAQIRRRHPKRPPDRPLWRGPHGRDFTYIDDLVEGVVRLIDRACPTSQPRGMPPPRHALAHAPFRIVNIGRRNPVALFDYVDHRGAVGKPAVRASCRCSPATCHEPRLVRSSSRRSPASAPRRPSTPEYGPSSTGIAIAPGWPSLLPARPDLAPPCRRASSSSASLSRAIAASPIGAVLLISVLALVTRRRRIARGLVLVAILALWIASMPAFANWLYGGLEEKYPAQPMASLPTADVVIVLGGIVGQPLPPRIVPDHGAPVDRIFHAARIFRAGKATTVLVAGGNQPWQSSVRPEAELIADILVELGVPRGAILVENASRNTYENAVNSAVLMQAHGLRTASPSLRRCICPAPWRRSGAPASTSPPPRLTCVSAIRFSTAR